MEAGGATRAALRAPGVRRLVGGFAGVTLGEWVAGTVVAVHAFDVGGPLAVGLVGFRYLPAAVAGLLLIPLIDRFPRERILTVTAAARAGLTAAMALLLLVDAPFALVLAVVWLDAMAGSTYRPAQAALLPSLTRTPSELAAATTLVSNAKTSSQAFGALGGGVLVAVLPVTWAVAVGVALHLAAAVLTAGVRAGTVLVSDGRGLWSSFTALASAAGFLRRETSALRIVTYAGLRALVRGLWIALAVIAAAELLGLGRAGFGTLMAVAGVGSLVAILVTALLVARSRLAMWLAVGLVAASLPVAAVAAGAAPLALAVMLVWGLGMSVSDVAASALLNRVVPAGVIGRVSALMESGKLLWEGVGALVAPALVWLFGLKVALLVAGLAVPLVIGLDSGSFRRIDQRAAGRMAVLELVRRAPSFAPLRLDALEGVVARMQPAHAEPGTAVVRAGENGDSYYLIEQGTVDVEIDGYLVACLGPGEGFGERALLRGSPRSATVRARTSTQLLRLSRDDFLGAVAGSAEIQLSPAAPGPVIDTEDALAAVPLLHGCSQPTLAELARAARIDTVAAGSPIVVQGEAGDVWYVLLSGRASVVVDGAERGELLPGDSFGEIAVLHSRPRTATVLAAETVEVLVVPGERLRVALRERPDVTDQLPSLD